MDIKSIVQTKIASSPPRIILHGPHGIGKTTFAAYAPKPIFLQTEDGLTALKKENIEVPHFPLAKSWEQVVEYLGILINQDHDYKTFVLDTADWLERLIWHKVCIDAGDHVNSIEDIGYGKGYNFALKHWETLTRGLNKLREDKGMAILILAHNEVKPYNPPDANPYDRYQIKLHKSAAALMEEWADAVLFANFKVYVKGGDEKKSGKAVGGQRTIYTQPNPAWRAKNRYSLPEEMEMDFSKLLTHIKE